MKDDMRDRVGDLVELAEDVARDEGYQEGVEAFHADLRYVLEGTKASGLTAAGVKRIVNKLMKQYAEAWGDEG